MTVAESAAPVDTPSMKDWSDNTASSGSIAGFKGGRAVPPPPAGPSLSSRQRASDPDADLLPRFASASSSESPGRSNSRVFPFDAELEMAEIEHGKAGLPWSARARTLSTSSLSLSSRRMCYTDRRVIVAVHRLDNKPLMLLARVADCRYESDGLYTIDLELLPTDESGVKVSFSRKAI